MARSAQSFGNKTIEADHNPDLKESLPNSPERFRNVEREGGLSRCVTTTFGPDAMDGIFALAFWAQESLPGGHPVIILGMEGKGGLGSHREDQ